MIPAANEAVPWTAGQWFNAPPAAEERGDELVVTAAEGSDLWRTTSYDFIHDDGHALLRPFASGTAVEVAFRLDYERQFDQAGVLVRGDARHWVKAGVEVSDGLAQLGAVVTHDVSDWSVGPVADWTGALVTIRVSRRDDALTVRARRGDADWQLVRVAPWPPELSATAGPFCCAPSRAGLQVTFDAWRVGAADDELHAEST